MSSTAWADDIRRLHDDAAGLLNLDVVRRCDAPGLMLAAAAGNADAARLLLDVNDFLARIQSAPAKSPMECGCCGKPLRQGSYNLVVARPAEGDMAKGLGLAICYRCGTSLGAIKAAAITSLRLIWPQARCIEITHPDGGRA